MTRQVMAGSVKIGGGAPVSVQSMLSVPSYEINKSVQQAVALQQAGCEIIRLAIPDREAVRLIPAIKEKVSVPPRRLHSVFRPPEPVLYHLEYARSPLPVLESGSRKHPSGG